MSMGYAMIRDILAKAETFLPNLKCETFRETQFFTAYFFLGALVSLPKVPTLEKYNLTSMVLFIEGGIVPKYLLSTSTNSDNATTLDCFQVQFFKTDPKFEAEFMSTILRKQRQSQEQFLYTQKYRLHIDQPCKIVISTDFASNLQPGPVANPENDFWHGHPFRDDKIPDCSRLDEKNIKVFTQKATKFIETLILFTWEIFSHHGINVQKENDLFYFLTGMFTVNLAKKCSLEVKLNVEKNNAALIHLNHIPETGIRIRNHGMVLNFRRDQTDVDSAPNDKISMFQNVGIAGTFLVFDLWLDQNKNPFLISKRSYWITVPKVTIIDRLLSSPCSLENFNSEIETLTPKSNDREAAGTVYSFIKGMFLYASIMSQDGLLRKNFDTRSPAMVSITPLDFHGKSDVFSLVYTKFNSTKCPNTKTNFPPMLNMKLNIEPKSRSVSGIQFWSDVHYFPDSLEDNFQVSISNIEELFAKINTWLTDNKLILNVKAFISGVLSVDYDGLSRRNLDGAHNFLMFQQNQHILVVDFYNIEGVQDSVTVTNLKRETLIKLTHIRSLVKYDPAFLHLVVVICSKIWKCIMYDTRNVDKICEDMHVNNYKPKLDSSSLYLKPTKVFLEKLTQNNYRNGNISDDFRDLITFLNGIELESIIQQLKDMNNENRQLVELFADRLKFRNRRKIIQTVRELKNFPMSTNVNYRNVEWFGQNDELQSLVSVTIGEHNVLFDNKSCLSRTILNSVILKDITYMNQLFLANYASQAHTHDKFYNVYAFENLSDQRTQNKVTPKVYMVNINKKYVTKTMTYQQKTKWLSSSPEAVHAQKLFFASKIRYCNCDLITKGEMTSRMRDDGLKYSRFFNLSVYVSPEVYCPADGSECELELLDNRIDLRNLDELRGAFVSVTRQSERENRALINMGEGNDTVHALSYLRTIFLIGSGAKEVHGSDNDDYVLIHGKIPNGTINGKGGQGDIVDLSRIETDEDHNLMIKIDYQTTTIYNEISTEHLELKNVEKYLFRKGVGDFVVITTCAPLELETFSNLILIGWVICPMKINLKLGTLSYVTNTADRGQFTYYVSAGLDEVYVEVSALPKYVSSTSIQHIFMINSSINNIESIENMEDQFEISIPGTILHCTRCKHAKFVFNDSFVLDFGSTGNPFFLKDSNSSNEIKSSDLIKISQKFAIPFIIQHSTKEMLYIIPVNPEFEKKDVNLRVKSSDNFMLIRNDPSSENTILHLNNIFVIYQINMKHHSESTDTINMTTVNIEYDNMDNQIYSGGMVHLGEIDKFVRHTLDLPIRVSVRQGHTVGCPSHQCVTISVSPVADQIMSENVTKKVAKINIVNMNMFNFELSWFIYVDQVYKIGVTQNQKIYLTPTEISVGKYTKMIVEAKRWMKFRLQGPKRLIDSLETEKDLVFTEHVDFGKYYRDDEMLILLKDAQEILHLITVEFLFENGEFIWMAGN